MNISQKIIKKNENENSFSSFEKDKNLIKSFISKIHELNENKLKSLLSKIEDYNSLKLKNKNMNH